MANGLEQREPRWRKGKQNPPTRRQVGAKAFRKTLTEDQLHRSVAEFLDWTLGKQVFWTTFPAGWGKLSKTIAGRLKASGLKDGVPDTLIIDEGEVFFIELKIPGKKPTRGQEATHVALAYAGARVATCSSLEEVDKILNLWGVARRASVTLAHSVAETRQQAQFAQGSSQGQ